MTFDQDRQKVFSETIWGVEFTNDVLFNGSEGNKMHLYWVPTYEKLPGLQRDLQQGRAWKTYAADSLFANPVVRPPE